MALVFTRAHVVGGAYRRQFKLKSDARARQTPFGCIAFTLFSLSYASTSSVVS